MAAVIRCRTEFAHLEQVPLPNLGKEHRPIRQVHQRASPQPQIKQFSQRDAALPGNVQGKQ